MYPILNRMISTFNPIKPFTFPASTSEEERKENGDQHPRKPLQVGVIASLSKASYR
jgi:hypothetical protein